MRGNVYRDCLMYKRGETLLVDTSAHMDYTGIILRDYKIEYSQMNKDNVMYVVCKKTGVYFYLLHNEVFNGDEFTPYFTKETSMLDIKADVYCRIANGGMGVRKPEEFAWLKENYPKAYKTYAAFVRENKSYLLGKGVNVFCQQTADGVGFNLCTFFALDGGTVDCDALEIGLTKLANALEPASKIVFPHYFGCKGKSDVWDEVLARIVSCLSMHRVFFGDAPAGL